MSRVRIRMRKLGRYAFLSHLDMMRALERAIRRSGLTLAYSEGFHPHARISFAAPLAVGITSTAEVADIEFQGEISPSEVLERVNSELPPELQIEKAGSVDPRAPSLMSEIAAARYTFSLSPGADMHCLENGLRELLERDELLLAKSQAGDEEPVNVRPLIIELKATKDNQILQIQACLATGAKANLRPDDLIKVLREYRVLQQDISVAQIQRTELLVERGGRLVPPI